jgi:peptidoglycan/LPS O-acetylase OafA/YrhL
LSDVSNPRAYELDILRRLAALFVVIHHWRFLFFPMTFVAPNYDALPLHTILMPIYSFGELFVELFFSISGYVFFWLYADAIADRQIDVKRFFTCASHVYTPCFSSP